MTDDSNYIKKLNLTLKRASVVYVNPEDWQSHLLTNKNFYPNRNSYLSNHKLAGYYLNVPVYIDASVDLGIVMISK